MNMSLRARIVALSVTVGLAYALPATAQDQRTLSYATFYGTAEFYEISATRFMEQVTERTNGAIQWETYYGGTLLKPAEITPGLGRGVADMAVGVPAGFNKDQWPLTGVVLPFMTENPMAATYAFEELYETTPELQAEFETNNVKFLWALASGENSLWTNKAINTLDDLRGARIRSVLGVADALIELGATPVSVPWVEALELMQRGGVEGVSATPFNQASTAGTLDMATHASNGGRMGVYAVVIWGMNLDKWNELEPETQTIMEEIAAGIPEFYFERYDAEVDKAVEAVKASQVEYVHLDDAEVARWQDIAKPAIEQRWLDASGGHGIEPAALLEKFKGLVEKYENEYDYTPGFDRLSAN